MTREERIEMMEENEEIIRKIKESHPTKKCAVNILDVSKSEREAIAAKWKEAFESICADVDSHKLDWMKEYAEKDMNDIVKTTEEKPEPMTKEEMQKMMPIIRSIYIGD